MTNNLKQREYMKGFCASRLQCPAALHDHVWWWFLTVQAKIPRDNNNFEINAW
jgi:hypothetical protein